MPRLNFTGRRKISHRHVRISVTGIGGIESMSAAMDLSAYRFPPDARIVVEAMRQLDLVRFEYGTVAAPAAVGSCRLSEFATLAGLRFRLKVVSADHPRGRLLGVADRMVPQEAHRESLLRVPLLAVRSQDLGREIWRLDFSDEPVLLVNPRVAGRKALARSPEFQSLVLPEILRSILHRIVLQDGVRTCDDPAEWSARWLRFACSLPGVGELSLTGDRELDLDWIAGAVGAFCRWRSVDRQFATFWRAGP